MSNLAQTALRAGPDANPPFNMHRALIFNGAFIMTTAFLVFFIRGREARKELDQKKLEQSLHTRAGDTSQTRSHV